MSEVVDLVRELGALGLLALVLLYQGRRFEGLAKEIHELIIYLRDR